MPEVSIDIAVCVSKGRDVGVECVLDVDANERVIGVEVLSPAFAMGVAASDLKPPRQPIGRRVAIDDEADALSVSLADGMSRRQVVVDGRFSIIEAPEGGYLVRLTVDIPSSLRWDEAPDVNRRNAQ